ncbi:MAG TPA: hypothetical protein VF135_02900, partial [Terriglobales bacterium]
MRLSTISILIAFSCSVAVASDKPDFSGTWRLDGSPDQKNVVEIEQQDDNIHVISKSTDDATEIKCDTVGKECEGTLS